MPEQTENIRPVGERILKRAPLYALLTANGISMVGNMFAMIAIPWFVLQTTGSPAKTGVTGFFTTLAAVVAAFFGGAVVDRLGFKRTSITADIASGITVLFIPLLHVTFGLQYWQLLILVFAGAFLDAPGTTAREALIPELAEQAGMSLERASAAIQAVERGSRMIGAPLSGILIALIGTQNVLWLDAFSFGVSALIVALAVPAIRVPAHEAEKPRHYIGELQAGIRFILQDRLLFAIVLIVVITNFLDAPLFGVIYPVYIRQFFGNAVNLGLLVAAGGGGSLLSALIFGAIGHKLPRRALFFGGFMLITIKFWVMALVPPFWVIFLAALINGLAAGPINPIITTLSYERIPIHYRGRVLGTLTAMAYIAIPLGVLLGGYLLEFTDVRLLLAAIGLCYLLTVVAFTFNSATRQMNVRKPVEAGTDSVQNS